MLERGEDGTVYFAVICKRELIQPYSEKQKKDRLTKPIVMWDASLSGRTNHEKTIQYLKALLEGEQTPIRLQVFRDQAEDVKDFSTKDELFEYLDTIVYDGSSNLGAVIQKIRENKAATVLFFSDMKDFYSGSKDDAKVPGDLRIHSFLTSGLFHFFSARTVSDPTNGETIPIDIYPPELAKKQILMPSCRLTGC